MSAVDNMAASLSDLASTSITGLANAVAAAESVAGVVSDTGALFKAQAPEYVSENAELVADISSVPDTGAVRVGLSLEVPEPPEYLVLDIHQPMQIPSIPTGIAQVLPQMSPPTVSTVSVPALAAVDDLSVAANPTQNFVLPKTYASALSGVGGGVGGGAVPDFAERFTGEVVSLAGESYVARLKQRRDVVLGELRQHLSAWSKDLVNRYAPGYERTVLAGLAGMARGLSGGAAVASADGIFLRARDRAKAAADAVLDGAVESARGRGARLPRLMLDALAEQVSNSASDAASGLENAIEIERWQMEADFSADTLSVAEGYFASVIGFIQAMLEVHLDAESHALDLGVKAAEVLDAQYRQSLELLKADLRLYLARARVYEAEVKAAMAEIEQDRLQVEDGLALNDIDALRARSAEGVARLESGKVAVYREGLAAAGRQLDARLLAVSLFGQEVDNALDQAENQGRAQAIFGDVLQGAEAELSAMSASLKQYRYSLSAAETIRGVARQRMRVGRTINENLFAAFRAEVEAMAVGGEQSLGAARIESRNVRAALAKYQAQLAQDRVNLDLEVENAQGALDAATANFEAGLRAFSVGAKALIEELNQVAGAYAATVEAFGETAAHAVAGLNGIAGKIEDL